MKRTSRTIAAATTALALLLSTPGAMAAQDGKQSPGDLALEGITTLMEALEVFVESIPQYEAPEILPNGDIIIRRKDNPNDRDKGNDGSGGMDEDATEL